MTEQQKEFWGILEIFKKEGLLPYVMLIGSWAEFIYELEMKDTFKANLKTRDVDFVYTNINKPSKDIRIIQRLAEKGFVYKEDFLTGVGKFLKEDLLELEFLTRAFGAGKSVNNIPSLNIKAESLRDINMLVDYPMDVTISSNVDSENNFTIIVPEKEAYVLQKMMINESRKPEYKKEKDIQSVEGLLAFVDPVRLNEIFSSLTPKMQNKIIATNIKYAVGISFTESQ